MRRYLRSMSYAVEGLLHAVRTERNLRLFIVLYILSFVIATVLGLPLRDWQMVVFTGGIFLSVELVNTALEHFTDAFDEHSKSIHRSAIKATKDIASAAALICGLAWGVTLAMLFLPHLGNLHFGGIGAGM